MTEITNVLIDNGNKLGIKFVPVMIIQAKGSISTEINT